MMYFKTPRTILVVRGTSIASICLHLVHHLLDTYHLYTLHIISYHYIHMIICIHHLQWTYSTLSHLQCLGQLSEFQPQLKLPAARLGGGNPPRLGRGLRVSSGVCCDQPGLSPCMLELGDVPWQRWLSNMYGHIG